VKCGSKVARFGGGSVIFKIEQKELQRPKSVDNIFISAKIGRIHGLKGLARKVAGWYNDL